MGKEATAQNLTEVDVAVKTLESQLIFPLDHWKLSTDIDANPLELSQANYDDTAWRCLDLKDEDVFQNGCWLRKVIHLPEAISGQKVAGQLNLFISINDLAELWIDGNYKDSWQWDRSIPLSLDAHPGEKIVILIKAFSIHPMFLISLSEAYLILDEAEPVKEIIDNLTLSLKTAQKLLSSDTSLKNDFLTVDSRVDNSTLNTEEKKKLYTILQRLVLDIDVKALITGNHEQFCASVETLKIKLEPFREFVHRFTLHFTSNAHLDAAWLWREAESIEAAKRTFDTALKLMDERKNLTYLQTSAAYYEWMEKYHPEIFEKIQAEVAQGNWEITGGTWIEPDANLPDGESWRRQLLYGQKYFKEKFNKTALVAFFPDTFGFNWNLPQFLSNAGIDFFITAKMNCNDTTVFPHRLFWWQAPDGARVLSYIITDYTNIIDNPFKMIEFVRQFEANTGFRDVLFLFGMGDHGGGPTWQMLQRLERLSRIWVFPKIEFTTLERYFDIIKKNTAVEIPVWKDELYLEFHRGTFTTQANTKKWNRDGEILLTSAEKFSALANLNEQTKLEKAWKNVVFNQFHDILSGTCVPSVMPDVYEKYENAAQMGTFVLNKSLSEIAKTINTNELPDGEPIVLFNGLGWDRKSIVSCNLPAGSTADYIILDPSGNEVPSQIIVKNELEREIIFKARVPAIGYAVYGLKKQRPAAYKSQLCIKKNYLENRCFKIEIDEKTGWIRQIIDKQNNKEILSGPANQLQLLGNRPALWKAWNIKYTGEKFYLDFCGGEIVENGAVRIVYRLKYNFLRPGVRRAYPTEDFPTSFFTQDIILYHNVNLIEFRTEVDWWEDELVLKVAFPLNVKGCHATYEIPFGTIHRSSDLSKSENKAKFEVPALRWADLSDDNYGVSLINNSKYGYDTDRNVMRLTLLNSPRWPDPNANRGKNIITYWLYPHQGDWKEAKTKRKGYEVNNEILCFKTDRHAGQLPLKYSYIQIAPDNIILTTIKYAEDGENAWVLQWYESEGKQTKTILKLPFRPRRVTLTNFMEDDIQQIDSQGNVVEITTGPYKIQAIKVFL